ncbi:MAG TPA: glucosaminidase domain-containing protein, partial [Rubrivivax sp.]|nr:glucosaminidase domain-containing protein [Rubrivivax sp.]
MAAGPLDNRLAFDARSLDALRSRAAADPKSAVRETARQFEALFMQELMKSMRATTTGGGLGGDDTAGAQMGTEMLDSQYASQLSGLPGGLSEAITRHLERQMGLSPGPIPHTGSANNTPPPLAAQPAPTRIPQLGAAGFVQQHGAAAREAEAATGIPAAFMVAQAAHETGWGRKEIRHADGTPAFNLFGIKAGAGWRGPVAEVTTTEYAGGTPRKTVEKFRAYGSYAESFADYARLMKDSPRYSGVVARVSALAAAHKPTEAAAGFAHGLQGAGYAT